jgi:hypothetical protein
MNKSESSPNQVGFDFKSKSEKSSETCAFIDEEKPVINKK